MTPTEGVAGRTRLMLVDDHEIVRRGIRSLVEKNDEWGVVAEVADGAEVLKVAEEVQPDLIVLDISLPNVDGVDLITQLKRLLPKVEILVLTLHESERIMAQALRAGARGYLLKSDSGDRFLEALRALSRHQAYYSSAFAEPLIQSYLRSRSAKESDVLTPRERQIVILITEGNNNRQIAKTLNISIKTVETHRATAMRKIGAGSTAEIALYAVRNGLVQV